MSIDHWNFQNILGEYVKGMNLKRFRLLRKVKIFYGWDRPKLGGLFNHIYVRSPTHSSYVYKKGDTDANIYIIVSGQLEITAPLETVKTNLMELEEG